MSFRDTLVEQFRAERKAKVGRAVRVLAAAAIGFLGFDIAVGAACAKAGHSLEAAINHAIQPSDTTNDSAPQPPASDQGKPDPIVAIPAHFGSLEPGPKPRNILEWAAREKVPLGSIGGSAVVLSGAALALGLANRRQRELNDAGYDIETEPATYLKVFCDPAEVAIQNTLASQQEDLWQLAYLGHDMDELERRVNLLTARAESAMWSAQPQSALNVSHQYVWEGFGLSPDAAREQALTFGRASVTIDTLQPTIV